MDLVQQGFKGIRIIDSNKVVQYILFSEESSGIPEAILGDPSVPIGEHYEKFFPICVILLNTIQCISEFKKIFPGLLHFTKCENNLDKDDVNKS